MKVRQLRKDDLVKIPDHEGHLGRISGLHPELGGKTEIVYQVACRHKLDDVVSGGFFMFPGSQIETYSEEELAQHNQREE